MRVRGDVRRHTATSRAVAAGASSAPVIDEDVRLVLGRQVDRGPASIGTAALLRVHRVDEMRELEFRRAADRMISAAGAPEQHDRARLAEPAKHLQGPGPQ